MSKQARKSEGSGSVVPYDEGQGSGSQPSHVPVCPPAEWSCKHPPGSLGYNLLYLCNQLREELVAEEGLVSWLRNEWVNEPGASPLRQHVVNIAVDTNNFLVERFEPVVDKIRKHAWPHRAIISKLLSQPHGTARMRMQECMHVIASELGQGDRMPALFRVLDLVKDDRRLEECIRILGSIFDRVCIMASEEHWDENRDEYRVVPKMVQEEAGIRDAKKKRKMLAIKN